MCGLISDNIKYLTCCTILSLSPSQRHCTEKGMIDFMRRWGVWKAPGHDTFNYSFIHYRQTHSSCAPHMQYLRTEYAHALHISLCNFTTQRKASKPEHWQIVSKLYRYKNTLIKMSEVNVFMSTSDNGELDQLLQTCSWMSQTQMVGTVTTIIMLVLS